MEKTVTQMESWQHVVAVSAMLSYSWRRNKKQHLEKAGSFSCFFFKSLGWKRLRTAFSVAQYIHLTQLYPTFPVCMFWKRTRGAFPALGFSSASCPHAAVRGDGTKLQQFPGLLVYSVFPLFAWARHKRGIKGDFKLLTRNKNSS